MVWAARARRKWRYGDSEEDGRNAGTSASNRHRRRNSSANSDKVIRGPPFRQPEA